ncbi:glycosyltransferase family 4 protein [Mucilaginibacter sp. AW1-3]
MKDNIIVHVSEVNVSSQSGMGRIEYHWKLALEKAGYTFVHIGPTEIGKVKHPALIPRKAYQYYKSLNIKPKAFIVHEPASGYFVNRGIPCFIESHGIERRYFEAQVDGSVPSPLADKISLKTRILYPLWRLRGGEKGLRNATGLLLSNTDDKEYVKKHYGRKDADIMVFKNGINAVNDMPVAPNAQFTILFNATWQLRKGIRTLVQAAEILHQQGLNINYLLIGTGAEENDVMNAWPEQLRPNVKSISRFAPEDEPKFLASASLFVLPSYFEGQPLSLLQAMGAGKCCITTNNCGQKDVIDNGKTGLLFEAGDYNAFASLISKCYHDKELINTIGVNAKEYMKNLTWDKVSQQVADYVLAGIK